MSIAWPRGLLSKRHLVSQDGIEPTRTSVVAQSHVTGFDCATSPVRTSLVTRSAVTGLLQVAAAAAAAAAGVGCGPVPSRTHNRENARRKTPSRRAVAAAGGVQPPFKTDKSA